MLKLETYSKYASKSEEHFSVDGSLVEAWASHKSFKPQNDASDSQSAQQQQLAGLHELGRTPLVDCQTIKVHAARDVFAHIIRAAPRFRKLSGREFFIKQKCYALAHEVENLQMHAPGTRQAEGNVRFRVEGVRIVLRH